MRASPLLRRVFGASTVLSASASTVIAHAKALDSNDLGQPAVGSNHKPDSSSDEQPVRVPLATLQSEFLRVLRSERVGLPPDVAALCARLFMENQRDGVYSHGLNRFGGFASAVADGRFDKGARPTPELRFGCVEQWDGHCGIGLWNAHVAMSRAVELARTHGIGCVALRNTNHWMRAGSYGLQAARAGCVGICFTNTCPLLPPWGSAEARIGNNPLCVAIPRGDSQEPLLLDMAMVRQQIKRSMLFLPSQTGGPRQTDTASCCLPPHCVPWFNPIEPVLQRQATGPVAQWARAAPRRRVRRKRRALHRSGSDSRLAKGAASGVLERIRSVIRVIGDSCIGFSLLHAGVQGWR